MGGTYTMSYTPITGDTITAARWITANSEHIAGNDFTGLGDYSASNAEMRTTTDPYASATESLATDGKGELERLRYVVGQLGGRVNQSGYWYQDPLMAQIFQARLTLTTATPVTTSDVTAATTVYLTPYKGSIITLYDGTSWLPYTLTEISIAVPATTATMYDLFVYDNSGTLTLDATAWTNDTTRATALATQNGVYVKTGATGRRYVGSFRTTGSSGQTEDSVGNRYLWNYYNRVLRPMRRVEGTNSWTYTTATFRQANGASANLVDMVIGVSEDVVTACVVAAAEITGAGVIIVAGIGVDSTSTNSANLFSEFQTVATTRDSTHAFYRGFPGAGRHYLAWLEYSGATGTTTWYGDNGGSTIQSGIVGELLG